MESLFPPISAGQLPDRSAAPLHETKRRPSKLPIIPGAQLTLSRSKLGEMLDKPTTDFLLKDPVPDMKPDYNSLHDPHLRDYYHRRDLNDRLKKGNFITADNEVICSLKDYNTYEVYLECLKAVADKTYHEKHSGKLRKFIELQEKGLIPAKLSFAEIEALLGKNSQAKLKDDCGQSKECLYRALDMEKFKEEDRARLMMFENQYRHEHKREKYLKDGQEQRDRKKQASMEKKSARQQKKIMMESWVVMEVCTEGPARGEHVCLHPGKPCADYLEPNPETAGSPGHSACKTDQASVDKRFNREQTVVVESEIVNEVQPEDTKLGEHQRLLPARPHMKHPDPHTDTTNSHGHQACKVDQKQASVLRECAIQKKKSQGKIILTEESKRIEECVNDTGNPDEKFPEAPWQKHQPRSSQPERLCTELPALQSSLAKIYGNKGIRVDQKLAKKKQKIGKVKTEASII